MPTKLDQALVRELIPAHQINNQTNKQITKQKSQAMLPKLDQALVLILGIWSMAYSFRLNHILLCININLL